MKFKPPGDDPVSIGLTSGHSIVIHPDGTDVPPHFRKEALGKGCKPVGFDIDGPERTKEPTKEELISAAIDKLLDSDDTEAFGKDGRPNVTALSAAAGFEISASERNTAWDAYEAALKDDDKGK